MGGGGGTDGTGGTGVVVVVWMGCCGRGAWGKGSLFRRPIEGSAVALSAVGRLERRATSAVFDVWEAGGGMKEKGDGWGGGVRGGEGSGAGGDRS